MKYSKEDFGEKLEASDVYRKIAERLNPALSDESDTRAWKWKQDLMAGKKDKFDLYGELARAPGSAFYDPTPQQRAAHQADTKVKQVSGGWRGGKSKWLAAELLPYMFRDDAYLWIVANNYNLARYEWVYVADWLKWLDAPIIRYSNPNNGRWTLELAWGARLETMTADDVTNIEGANLDAVGVAEAGLMDEAIIRRLRGRVLESRGPILLSGSLDVSQNWYMEAFQDFIKGPTDISWHSFSLPSWENIQQFPLGLEDPELIELKMTMTEDEFKLKVCAEAAKPEELVFPEFDKRVHVMNFEFSDVNSEGFRLETPEEITDTLGIQLMNWRLPRRGEVMLAIDPGYRGAYAVLACRKYGDNIFVIDEVYLKFQTVEDVIKECKTREWWSDVTYAVMDIAAKQHAGMVSHFEIWEKPEHLGFRPGTNFVHVTDGIQRLRTFLRSPLNRRPRVWFHHRCKETIREFALYRYRTSKEGRPDKEEPVDKFNHSLKALSYLLVDRYGATDGTGRAHSEKYLKHLDMRTFMNYGWSRWQEYG